MAIRAIIFDCFGVLILRGRTALFHDYPKLSSDIHDLELQSDYGYISRHEFNESIGSLVGLSSSEVDKRYWSGNVRNEPVFEVVREVRGEGKYKTGLLTNVGRDWLGDVLPAHERQALFDSEIISGDVGMIKPAREIYELSALRLGVLPSECVMIDDVESNVDGARGAGMQGIVFVSVDQLRADLAILNEDSNARAT